jgi:outer membrane biosynthesis protein TonB
MNRFFIYSLVLHIIVVVLLVVGFNFDLNSKKPTEIPISMVFEKVEQKRAAPKLKPKPPKPDIPVESDLPEEVVEQPVTKPEPKQTPPKIKEVKKQPEPEPIKPEPAIEPLPAPKIKPKPKPKKPKAVKVKRKPKVRPKAIKKLKKPKKVKQQDKQAFEDLLKEIDMQDQDSDEQAIEADNIAEQVTASEIDAVRQTIYRCWIVPAGARGAKDLKVDIEMQVNQDGRVYKADIVNSNRYNNDPFFRAAAESAQRAVLNPACNNLPLDPAKYDQWKSITMTFNPEDMFSD